MQIIKKKWNATYKKRNEIKLQKRNEIQRIKEEKK